MLVHKLDSLAAFAVSQRKKLGLTQTQVGEKVGLKQKTISAFENNPQSVKLSTLFLILSALDLYIDVFPKGGTGVKFGEWPHPW